MDQDVKKDGFKLNEAGYFKHFGVDVMAFDDVYPEGHQSGVSLILHGNRIATNGDIRFEQTPGQWQPVPKQLDRVVDHEQQSIVTTLAYPDESRHLSGFNPMIYPDFEFTYNVKTIAQGDSIYVRVDLDRPIPKHFSGKLSFNLELFPGTLVGKPWIMDEAFGIFPEQPNSPLLALEPNILHTGRYNEADAKADISILSRDEHGYNPITADSNIAKPYAVGKCFTLRPDDPYSSFTVESLGSDLKLYDGRMNHNNGWFVLSSEVPMGETVAAIEWIIKPKLVEEWTYKAVIQCSQVGYHPAQEKIAVIELDQRTNRFSDIDLIQITRDGEKTVLTEPGSKWGEFLRYRYLRFDFSSVQAEGLYKIRYGDSESTIFKIAKDVYERGVWQPVLEYFLPVQMCHMRVSEKYRVWHGLCHHDDAKMAPVDFNHIDGYSQGPSTLTAYEPGEHVPGLDQGGWHDAGDFDLRIESQSGEVYILSLAYEAFDVDLDVTTIDQEKQICEIHQSDGKNDILQQIEHGLLSIIGGYKSLGRLYRGIISNDLRQYVHLGDSSTMSDGIKGTDDDRWIFTEDNPARELRTAAHLAAASRALENFNPKLSADALLAARELFEVTKETIDSRIPKIHAAAELYLTTEDDLYKDYLLSQVDVILSSMNETAWFMARAEMKMADTQFSKAFRSAVLDVKRSFIEQSAETPYGIPYRPHIWGAGWDIQRLGFEYYFLHDAYPDIFDPNLTLNALNFVLGCHPGSNTMSFASGVGTTSATVGYGLNRADWSFIPGGVISGTALIRPDFPELLVFPYLWQQVEYVLGGGSSHFMFIALAAEKIVKSLT